MIDHVQVVSVPVADQDRAKRFYVDTVGLELRNDADFGAGERWLEVAPRDAPTSLSLVTWFQSMPPGSLQGLVLGTPDIYTAYEELTRRGVRFTSLVREEFWGTFAVFEDEDANGLVLVQAPDAGGART